MVQQVLYNFFRSNKNKVDDMFCDIELFYSLINQNTHKLNEWYFQNMFTKKYWLHLKNYAWLTSSKQTYLHQGILNIILFQIHQYLEEDGNLSKNSLSQIKEALYSYSSQNKTTTNLSNLVKDALVLSTLKIQGKYNSNANKEIYKSIAWTLKNTIITNET